MNHYTSRTIIDHSPTASLFPLWAPHAHFQYSA